MASSRTSIPNSQHRASLASSPELHSLSRQISQKPWMDKNFKKRECIKFIASQRDQMRCCCGRSEQWHAQRGIPRGPDGIPGDKWHPYKHTEARVTDAYGTIEFQGGPHPSKAQYMRLSSLDSRQENVLTLLTKHWGLDLPKLLITVHGGILNFDLQPKLKRVFRKGLLKAARTTGAWIITNGTSTGVTRHVGDAISDRTTKARNKVVAIGIAPWGIVENRENLVGRDIVVPYHCVSSTKTNTSVLNSNHSYFLLPDNGTVSKYGGEILFRKKFEKYIAQQKISMSNDYRGHGVPVICVVLEGGANTIRSVLEYVTDTPPVPVVVCDGSGRAADLLAFTHKYTMDDGTMAESLRDQLILTIERTFQYTQEQAEKLFIELMLCVKKKELITVFRMGDREESKDIDLAILTALLQGTTANAIDQLNLALTWDRVDIARSHIFVYGQEWPEGALEVAMMDALINDRVDFVKLLLENGVSMQTFLTIPRLEDLYNTRQGPSNTLRYLVRDTKKHMTSTYRYTLPDIGQVLQHLMGYGFRSYYCRKRFRQKYTALKQSGAASLGNIVTTVPSLVNTKPAEDLFPYPFNDLMIWAVLMKRQKMALFMWQHGEEALAKSLMAGKLYTAMAHEADQDDLEIELTAEFSKNAKEFLNLSMELLEHCYKIDDDYTQQLLTYELKNFSEQTCLGLAVVANHRSFVSHTCCQVLLNDLWIGGLRMRKNTSFKVILGLVFPPYICALDFKSKEELQLMPQTMEEHLDELEDSASEMDMSLSSFSEDQENYNYQEEPEPSTVTFAPKETPLNGSAKAEAKADSSMFAQAPFSKKKSPLRIGKKYYEFYKAPVTKFWAHAIGYFTFLVLYVYTILERLAAEMTWAEVYVAAFIFTTAIEKVRQIIGSEPVNLSGKLKMYICQLWNILDTLGILMFTIGLLLRSFSSTLRDGQLVYTVDIIFWNIRILEILSVSKYLGPYIKIIGKLLRDMCYFLLIMSIAVTSFGIVRQSVHYQNDPQSWHMKLRNVWYYPYWFIYGELFAEEIDPCSPYRYPEKIDKYGNCNLYGAWIAPLLMFCFLLVCNILMFNLLIARFNATFIRNNANSKEIWMFQRYGLILQYETRPILPAPFIIITHIYLGLKFLRRKCQGKRDLHDNGLKLFLSHEDTEKLHDFEEECMEDLQRDKEIKFMNSIDERVRVTNERVENMSLRMDDSNLKENQMRLTLATLDHRLARMDEVTDSLSQAVSLLAHRRRSDVGSQDSLEPTYQQYNTSQDHPRGRTLSVSSNDVGDIRCMPSPMLVHSRRRVQGDQLNKFTNYTRRRQLSGSEFPIDENDQFVGDVPICIHSGKRDSDIPLMSAPTSRTQLNDEVKFSIGAVDLHNSGNKTDAPLAIEEGLEGGESTQRSRRHKFASGVVTFDVNDKDAYQPMSPDQPSINVMSPMDTDTHMSSGPQGDHPGEREGSSPDEGEEPRPPVLQINIPSNLTSMTGGTPSKRGKMYTGQPLVMPGPASMLPASMAFTPNSMPQSTSCVTPVRDPRHSDIPQSAQRDLSSMFNPLVGEYTSITDNIDTSCIEDCSPPRSPTAQSSIMFNVGDGYQEVEAKLSRERKVSAATDSKQHELKQAEEAERSRMEYVIRHRLRQISQDESGSISDLARVVVAELTAEDKRLERQ